MEGSSKTPSLPLKSNTPHQSPQLKVNPAKVPAVGGRFAGKLRIAQVFLSDRI